MSSTITISNHNRHTYRPQYSATRAHANASQPAAGAHRAPAHSQSAPNIQPGPPGEAEGRRVRQVSAAAARRTTKGVKRPTFRRRVSKFVAGFEEWMHYGIATVLSGIAVATMAYTTVTLLTTSHSFADATSNAVAGVLIVLILIEITRTVLTPPDSKGVAIRRLLMIAIMSALREVLWIGVNAGSGNTTTEIGKPLAMAISTVVVVGLAAAFVLVRRASGNRTS